MTDIYIARNYDGVNQAMVIAANLKEAAKRMGTSAYQLREHGWHKANGKDRECYMAATHNHVLFRPIDDYPPHTFWRLSRWRTVEVRAAREKSRKARA